MVIEHTLVVQERGSDRVQVFHHAFEEHNFQTKFVADVGVGCADHLVVVTVLGLGQ